MSDDIIFLSDLTRFEAAEAMQDALTLTIVIPAYNEEAGITKVVNGIKEKVGDAAEVLVIDDGSTDNTCQVALEAGAKVIRHPYNKGNGAAVKTGIRQAKGEIVLFMDADGQHDPGDIDELLRYIGEYDLVIGARDKRAESSRVRRFGNWVFNRLASYLSGVKIPDLTSGFRAAKRDMLMEFIHLLPNGFSYPTTTTLAFIKAGYNVKFLPIKMYRRVGQSKIRPLRDGIQFILIILRMITLFSPLKVFFPISVLLFVLGGGYALYTIATEVHITNSSVLLISMGIIIFLIGLVSEQIAALRFEGVGRGRG